MAVSASEWQPPRRIRPAAAMRPRKRGRPCNGYLCGLWAEPSALQKGGGVRLRADTQTDHKKSTSNMKMSYYRY